MDDKNQNQIKFLPDYGGSRQEGIQNGKRFTRRITGILA
jgi:hypothetical protein